MKKRGELVSLFVILICLVSFVSASSLNFTLGNYSIKDSYGYGEPISGKLDLTLSKVPADVQLVSNLGNISLRALLKIDGRSLPCESFNCSGIYSSTGSGATSKSAYAISAPQVFGVYFSGSPISVNSFSLGAYSTLEEKSTAPFQFSIGDSFTWQFNKPTENLSHYRRYSTGCFNPSANLNENYIGETPYCENVSLLDSSSYFIGANISGSEEVRDFTFSLKDHGATVATCDYSLEGSSDYQSKDLRGCFVSLDSPLPEGNYDACVSSKADVSNYTLKSENSGINCGFFGNSLNRTTDYSIYAYTPFYSSNSGQVDLGEGFPSSALAAANGYIQKVYSRDCTSGCIVPVTVSGSGVVVNFSNLLVRYSSSTGISVANKFYSVSGTIPVIDFTGTLNLDSLNWKMNSVGEKNLKLSLYSPSSGESENLLNESVNVVSSPVIKSLYPTSIPAGIEFLIYADVAQTGDSPTYTWDFGDGNTKTTYNNTISHLYQNLSNYVLTLSVDSGNYTSQKSFTITTVSPQAYLNSTFDAKQKKITQISSEIEKLNPLIKNFVKTAINPTGLQESLTKLKLEMDVAYSPETYVGIAQRLNSLILPISISQNEKKSSYLDGDSAPNPNALLSVSNINSSNMTGYSSAILAWEAKQTQIMFSSNNIRIFKEDRSSQDLLTYYNLVITSQFPNESYFVVSTNKSSLNIAQTNLDVQDLDGSTAFVLPAESTSQISFFVASPSNLSFFISPKLELLPLQKAVAPCNFNKVCEPDLGENYSNCRSDCKPVLPTIFLSLLLLIFLLSLYTLIQLWYKVKYENHLFKDRKELFNLAIFINTSKKENVPEQKMREALYSQLWTTEQINYAIRKSQGKNVGMPEIIPVDKIIMYFERKKMNQQVPVNPFPQVQMRNVQRPQFRPPFRR